MPVVSWSYPLLRFRWCPFRWGAREADLAMQSLLLLMAGIAFYRASPKPRLFAQVCLSIWPLLLRGKKGVDDELLVGCRGWHCGRVTQLVQRLLLCVCVRACVWERSCACVGVCMCVCQCEEEKERESLLKWYVMALACVRAVTEFANLRLFLLCQRQRRIPANGG